MYTTLIIFFMLAISVSFLCSLWEATLLSISPVYAQVRIQEGGYLGGKLQYFKDNIDNPLAAILTLNTFAHTIGAIGVGEQASLIWRDSNPAITGVVVPLVMTLTVLILSEIIPKTIGANYWEKFAPFTIYSLSLLIKVIYPLVWLCQLITRFFRDNGAKSVFSRSEYLTLTQIGEEHGVIRADEADIIKGTLDLYELRAMQVMRPIADMVMIGKSESIQTLLDLVKEHKYSRYPVYENDKHNIIGIVHTKDLIASSGDINKSAITDFVRPLLKVQTRLPVSNLLGRLREGMPHFAVVYNRNQEPVGFITMDNVLQILFGIIKDEFHQTHVDYTPNEDGTILFKGRCPIFVLEQVLDIDIDTGEDIKTIEELMNANLSQPAAVNDKVELNQFSMRVDKIDNDRIKRVTIIPVKSNSELN